MHINRGLLFWGLALVVGGATALAVQLDYIDRDILLDAWRLWPVILIVLGLAIILGRTPYGWLGTVAAALVVGIAGGVLLSIGPGSFTCGGPEPTVLDEHDGTFSGSSAEVDLEFNCGTLEVGMGDGSGWQAAVGSTDEDNPPRVTESASALTIRSPDEPFFGGGRQRWELTLGSDVSYDLNVSPNAASVDLDLGGGAFSRIGLSPNAGDIGLALDGATVDELRVSANAVNVGITVDGGSSVSGRMNANAGSLQLCAAPDTALRLTMNDSVAFSHNLDDSELDRSGDTWTTEGYESGDNQVELTVEGNAASFTLNPEGGCG
jgi:hypothetical protein